MISYTTDTPTLGELVARLGLVAKTLNSLELWTEESVVYDAIGQLRDLEWANWNVRWERDRIQAELTAYSAFVKGVTSRHSEQEQGDE